MLATFLLSQGVPMLLGEMRLAGRNRVITMRIAKTMRSG